jgi:CRISPR-associated protein Cas5d
MMKDWCLEVWGDYACFTRPEMKVERVSYDVMTPSSARAIFDSILWKPPISWHITKIEVINPVKWISVRRNEVGIVASERSNGIFIEDSRQQRAGLFLRDVCYRIHAWFTFTEEQKNILQADETEAKYAAMFERRAKKGQCFHRPYLGCREFACEFRLIEKPDAVKAIDKNEDLGWMLYDINFEDPNNPRPEFFRARLENGILNTDRRQVEVRS